MTPVMPDENQCFLEWRSLKCLQQEDLKKKKKKLQIKKKKTCNIPQQGENVFYLNKSR